jgi:flagellar biogenesis protein FliO
MMPDIRYPMLFLVSRAATFVAVSLLSASAHAQKLGQGSADADISVWQIFATLIFLASLILIAWVLIKMRGRQLNIFGLSAERQIEIIEVARISPQSSLTLVRFDGFEYLLAMTSTGSTVVEKRPAKVKPVADATLIDAHAL